MWSFSKSSGLMNIPSLEKAAHSNSFHPVAFVPLVDTEFMFMIFEFVGVFWWLAVLSEPPNTGHSIRCTPKAITDSY